MRDIGVNAWMISHSAAKSIRNDANDNVFIFYVFHLQQAAAISLEKVNCEPWLTFEIIEVSHLTRIDAARNDSGTNCVDSIVIGRIVTAPAFVGRENAHEYFALHTRDRIEFGLRLTESEHMATI